MAREAVQKPGTRSSADRPTAANSTTALPPLVAALLLLLGLVGSAAAHAVVYPGAAPTGAYQKYVLRVPNERTVATERVEITFPPEVRVISFDEVPGWELETESSDGGATFSSAVWTGNLPVGRFVEFGFIGVNPESAVRLKWDVVQVYEEGEAVAWTGPEESSTPASFTDVRPVGTSDGGGTDDLEPAGSDFDLGTILGAAALLVALLSLGLVLRPGPER